MLLEGDAQFVKLGKIVGQEDGVGVGTPAAEAVVVFGKRATNRGVLGRKD
jgi:hypothetical protein